MAIMSENETIQHKFKKDSYVRARGGHSEFFDVYCSLCQAHIVLYQKDGQGSLIRMYLDRIFEPESLSKLQTSSSKHSLQGLKCPNCNTLIGVPMVYKPENRLAFHLIRGSFSKKRSEGVYPPMGNTGENGTT